MSEDTNIIIQLREQCLAGDAQAWETLVAKSSPVIHRAAHNALKGCGRSTDSETVLDITQRVYVRLIRNDYRLLRQYDPARASWATWLSLLARSETLNFLKQQSPNTISLEQVPEVAVYSDAQIKLHIDDLLTSLDGRLTPAERQIARCLWRDGLEITDVAKILGVSPKTVYSHKRNIINKAQGIIYE